MSGMQLYVKCNWANCGGGGGCHPDRAAAEASRGKVMQKALHLLHAKSQQVLENSSSSPAAAAGGAAEQHGQWQAPTTDVRYHNKEH